MKKLSQVCLAIFLSLLLIFLFASSRSDAIQEEVVVQEEYVPNEVLVKFKENVSDYFIQNSISYVGGKIITYLKQEISPFHWTSDVKSFSSFRLDTRLFHIKVPEFIGTEQAIYLLSLNPDVEYAEKNLIRNLCSEPDDDEFCRQWALHNEGRQDQEGGTLDADIDAPEAWDIFTGSSDVVVAVIDTGVDYGHIDLQANIWTNPGESGGGKETNGIDDDNNGYIDDVHGWDFVNTDNDPMEDNSPKYHGTHIAGIIGAKGNNDEGIAGINWNVKIMVLKAGNYNGDFDIADIVGAIDYATENGAHLSNNSYGDYSYSQSEYNAIKRARDCMLGYTGKLFVASAGNGNNDNDSNPQYPSCYNLDNIISVLATDHNDNKSGYSNYGITTVDIGAPGGAGGIYNNDDIYSTKRYDDYRYLWGTSMAAPHVAGVAALLWGKCPLLQWQTAKKRIMENNDYLSSLENKTVTESRLNAYKAI